MEAGRTRVPSPVHTPERKWLYFTGSTPLSDEFYLLLTALRLTHSRLHRIDRKTMNEYATLLLESYVSLSTRDGCRAIAISDVARHGNYSWEVLVECRDREAQQRLAEDIASVMEAMPGAAAAVITYTEFCAIVEPVTWDQICEVMC